MSDKFVSFKDPRVKLIKHAVLSNHSASINCVTFSENGQFIATGSLDKVSFSEEKHFEISYQKKNPIFTLRNRLLTYGRPKVV